MTESQTTKSKKKACASRKDAKNAKIKALRREKNQNRRHLLAIFAA